MIEKELHARLEALSVEIKRAQEKMEIKKVRLAHDATLRDLKTRHELLTAQLRRDVKDPEGIGFLETAFRRWVNRLDFDE